ncbi:MAG: DegT/DnrJ/EryC1/StrS family aminotransferase [bacterium]|nr:MAG: DegT/DnrJ/EryC1/StrS family aminotransferase [bacterium]
MSAVKEVALPYKFGFVVGHSYLTEQQILSVQKVLESDANNDVIGEYEKKFAQLIGSGYGMSFASGRMAFYCLLKSLNVGPGDEVILPAFTCAVMPNAVWRTGATPIFSNLDKDTFGSSASAIEEKITSRTKIIVAQHSFGIPCKIKEIVDIAASKGIFVVEDSAITLGSRVDDIATGNFGHAAIFSTDHSKPLNTLIGGIMYTKEKGILDRIKLKFHKLPDLDKAHQMRIFQQILFERKWCIPSRYPKMRLKNYLNALVRKFKNIKMYSFLEADYIKPELAHSDYPYPANLPPFLAQLGLFELERWEKEKEQRQNILHRYLNIAKNSCISNYIHGVYSDPSLDIVPLRFVYRHPNSEQHRKIMSKGVDVGWTWFRSTVICCPNGPQDIGYSPGSCALSEQVCSDIINWPCVVAEGWEDKLVDFFGSVILSN